MTEISEQLLRRKKTVTAIYHDNQRGKHKNPPTVDAEITVCIKLHIDSHSQSGKPLQTCRNNKNLH